jgi:hypothetical protein
VGSRERQTERERERKIKGEAYNFHAKVHKAKRDLRGEKHPSPEGEEGRLKRRWNVVLRSRRGVGENGKTERDAEG